jgi:hypothetical protein
VRHAFLMAYQFENACRIQVDAMAGGRLVIPPADICALGPPMFADPRYTSGGTLEWAAMRRLADRVAPGYAD